MKANLKIWKSRKIQFCAVVVGALFIGSNVEAATNPTATLPSSTSTLETHNSGSNLTAKTLSPKSTTKPSNSIVSNSENIVAAPKAVQADSLANYFLNPLSVASLDGTVTESGVHFGWEIVLTDSGTLYVGIPATATNSVVSGGGNRLTNMVSDSSLVKKIVIATPCTVTDGFWGFFNKMSNVTTIDNLSALDTSAVTSMDGLFGSCSSLTSLDLTGFNTSNVTDMGGMFTGDAALTSLNVTSLDTSKNLDFYGMFMGLSSLSKLDLSNFNTSSGTDMTVMFDGDSQLTSLDLSSFNTSNVTQMPAMFRNMSALTSVNLSSFDTSNVNVMYSMFEGDSVLPQLDLSSFDTSAVTAMNHMFKDLSSLKQITLGKNFIFVDTTVADLPEYNPTSEYTGNWENVGSGTVDSPKGKNIWSAHTFMASYKGSVDADTYVWQPIASSAGKDDTTPVSTDDKTKTPEVKPQVTANEKEKSSEIKTQGSLPETGDNLQNYEVAGTGFLLLLIGLVIKKRY